ncbi:hypothetical protein ES705_24634 [subsurface metagenome]
MSPAKTLAGYLLKNQKASKAPKVINKNTYVRFNSVKLKPKINPLAMAIAIRTSIEVVAIDPLKTSNIFTAFAGTDTTKGSRAKYTIFNLVFPTNGNMGSAMYLFDTIIGIDANSKSMGLIIALRGLKSSIKPIIPAIVIVIQNMPIVNLSEGSDTMNIAIIDPIIIANRIIIPPISATFG